jgi:hypothetical protein
VKIVRYALLTIMTMWGAVIALRAIWGPLTYPVKVTNPLNPEDWFALALLLAMLARTDGPGILSRGATV